MIAGQYAKIQQEYEPLSPASGKSASRFEILYEKKEGVARLTINRPAAYNALTTETLREMIHAFRDAASDDAVAVVVLTGAGDKAFCAGGDAGEFSTEFLKRPQNYWKWQGLLYEAMEMFRRVGKPTIARVNGVVAGSGNGWNLAADFAIAADHVRFNHSGTGVGLVDAAGSTQWLPLMIGERRARAALLTGEEITAGQALEWGLVNQVVSYRQLDRAVNALVRKLTQRFPASLRYTREQLGFWKDLSWSMTAGHAREWLAAQTASWEPWEGVQAFVEKRPPDVRALRERAARGASSASPWGSPSRTCRECGAKGIPELFDYCGKCGSKLK
jgi:enoyl-CoA hydratase/carnithine racemase